MSHRTGMSRGVLLLALLCAVSFGAIVRVALAGDNNHVACVEHGFYAGSSGSDGSFFSRVYPGCSSTDRYCALVDSGGHTEGWTEALSLSGTCNTWSNDYGNFTECTSGARVSNPGVFSQHDHYASGSC
jgi:hypothetical protein